MRYVRLGKTGMEVSRIAFGTWALGGDWGDVDKARGERAIHAALDQGITFFDTAQGYGFGAAEQTLGAALWERVPRDKVVIATKGGLREQGDQLLRDASEGWLREGVESSLRHLGTDYIDLYQVHWPDLHTPAQETGGVLAELVREGKIRHVGVSNYDAAQMDELARYCPVETLQPPYSMFRRDVEHDILPYCAEHDIGVLVYGPLAEGLLGGRMDPGTDFPEDDWRRTSPDFSGDGFRRNLEVVERLKEVAAERRLSLPQLALAWVLSHPAVDVAIVGARRPEHLADSAAAADVELSDDDRRLIGDMLEDAVALTGPSPEM